MNDRSILSNLLKETVVYIDAANLERSVADLGTKPPNFYFKHIKKESRWKAKPEKYYGVDYKKLRKYFGHSSKLVGISFYTANFGTASHDNFLTFLKKIGYRLVTKNIKDILTSQNTHQRKANFDVEIAVDAFEFLSNYKTLILFSGDSDFAYLIKRLKKRGKNVIVISERGHVSRELVEVADSYYDLHNFIDVFISPRKQKSRR